MPLSEPSEREQIHCRKIECNGYRRADGLWDFDAQLVDTKSYGFDNHWRGAVEAGEPVHEMWIRLTINDDFVIQDIEAASDATPFEICAEAAPNFAMVKGLTVGPGWKARLRKRLGGAEGCTHLLELLGRMGTVCYQTIFSYRHRERQKARESEGQPEKKPDRRNRKPRLLNSCHAWRADGPVVEKYYPDHYTGGEADGDSRQKTRA